MTTKAEAKKIIIDAVIKAEGCRATELVGLHALELFEIEGGIGLVLDELVNEGELVEVEYVIGRRVKQFYLPARTETKIVSGMYEKDSWSFRDRK